MEQRRRLAGVLLDKLLAAVPPVLALGPRAVGKTTTGACRAATIVHLDRPAEAGVFRADPDAALRELPEPVLLDEWQAVRGVLGALKRKAAALFDEHLYVTEYSALYPGRSVMSFHALQPRTASHQTTSSVTPLPGGAMW